jgi:hypothetical protein
MRTLDRHPWLVKGWNPKQGRGDSENAGHFASGESHAGKPTDRTNADLDAAFADEPAKPKPAPAGDSRKNDALDDFMALGDEPPRHASRHTPGVDYANPDDRDSDDRYIDQQLAAAKQAQAEVAAIKAEIAELEKRGPKAAAPGKEPKAVRVLRRRLAAATAKVERAKAVLARHDPKKLETMKAELAASRDRSRQANAEMAAARRVGRPWQAKPGPGDSPPMSGRQPAQQAAQPQQGPPPEGQPDSQRGKAHADIAQGHMKMAQAAMKAGDKETAQKLLNAAYGHHLAATHHASGRHAEAEKAKQAADGHLAGVGGGNNKPGQSAGAAASRPGQVQPGKTQAPGKPHEQTQSAAVAAAKAVHQAASSGGDVKAANAKAHAALDAHHAAGHAEIDRMAREKHGEGTPQAKRAAEKAKAAFSAKVQAVRVKLDSLAGGKAGTQPSGPSRPERIPPRPPVPSRRGRSTGHPELKALDDRHRKATAQGKRGNPRALGQKVHAILSGLDRHDQAAVRRRYGIPEGASPERVGRAWMQWHEDNPGPQRKPKRPKATRPAPRQPGFIDGLLGRTTLTGKWKPGRRKAFDAALAGLSVTKAFAGAVHPWVVTKTHDIGDEPRDERGRWVARDNKHPFPIEEDFPFVAPGKITGEMRASAHWHDVPLDGLIATQSWVIGRQVEQMAAAGTERAEKPPVIVRMPDGRRYIEDGHHRATVAAVKGDSTFRAKVFDYDPATGEYTAAKVVKQLETDRHPWLCVRKTRDASGHEHAADGRFGRTSGSHDGKKDRPKADRHGKPERPARGGAASTGSGKAERLAARIAEVPKQLRAQVASFVRGRYRKLAKRYGPKGAMAIMGATVALLPVPVPGTSLLPIAIAEAVLAIRRAVRKSHDELDDATIQREARRLIRAIYAACGEEPPKGVRKSLTRYPWLVTKRFVESEHPRDHGEFAKKPGGKGKEKAPPAPKPKVPPANNEGEKFEEQARKIVNGKLREVKERAWTGEPEGEPISKDLAGAIGEEIIIQHLKSLGYDDAGKTSDHPAVASNMNNLAFDLIHDHQLIEAKGGQTGKPSGVWALKYDGRFTKAQEAAFAEMTEDEVKAEKKRINQQKVADIHGRKKAFVKRMSKELGFKVKPGMMTVIINHAKKTADIYQFDDIHDRIPWESDMARKGYVKTVRYG